jgi:hypothetical protein
MAENDHVRIEVAFDGGQSIGALVTPAIADGLEKALGDSPDGVFELEAEDGRYAIALRRVVYVKRFAREMRIGFAGAA